MTIDHSSPGKVILSMIDYIGKIIDNILDDMKGESDTPAAHHLFDIAEDAAKLSQADADIFHHFWHNYYIFQRGHVQTSSYQYPSYALE